MKKLFKSKFFWFCLTIFLIWLLFFKGRINYINMDIYIDSRGDARITETWNCRAYSGTEWYHPYYNLQPFQLTDFTVSENGTEYENISSWNVEASRENKKEKCGINIIGNRMELCWGMGKLGTHEYVVSYKINKFVDILEDSQMIYWTLIPNKLSDTVKKANIKIYAEKPFTEEVLAWGLGHTNPKTNITEEYIEIKTHNLNALEKMEVLIKLPEDFCESGALNKDKNFEYYKNKEILNDKETSSFKGLILLIILLPILVIILVKKLIKKHERILVAIIAISIMFLIPLAIDDTRILITLVMGLLLCIVRLIVTTTRSNRTKKLFTSSKDDVEYYREVPCNGNVLEMFYIASYYCISDRIEDLFGAFILKWIREDRAKLANDGLTIYPYASGMIEDKLERELYTMLGEISDEGKIPTRINLKNTKYKPDDFKNWFLKAHEEMRNRMIETGNIIKLEDGRKINYTESPEFIEKGKQIYGLKKFLQDYSTVNDRGIIDVHILEDYMIAAQLLGIADKLMETFKSIHPEYATNARINYHSYSYLRSTSRNIMQSSNSTRSGGFGGGGSHGGGAGGGGRR